MDSITEWIEQSVSVVTNDGRNMVGILRGFDQQTNLILSNCHERVHSPTDGVTLVALGLYVIRGDNVACVGEIDVDKDRQIDFKKVFAQPLNPPMSQDSKSQLNVICQLVWKRGATYASTLSGGAAHAPLWNAVCTLPDAAVFQVHNHLGSQKSAEQQAATAALEYLRRIRNAGGIFAAPSAGVARPEFGGPSSPFQRADDFFGDLRHSDPYSSNNNSSSNNNIHNFNYLNNNNNNSSNNNNNNYNNNNNGGQANYANNLGAALALAFGESASAASPAHAPAPATTPIATTPIVTMMTTMTTTTTTTTTMGGGGGGGGVGGGGGGGFTMAAPAALAAAAATAAPLLSERQLQCERVTVFVDTDNIGFVDANVCAQYPFARFFFYASFQRNLPFVDAAVKRCANARRRDALHNGSDVCDVMILFDVVRLHDYLRLSGEAAARRIVILSGDKMLYNAELLLGSEHVKFLGALQPLVAHLDQWRP